MQRTLLTRAAVLIALASACIAVGAQEKKPAGALPPVTVTAAAQDPVEKSYRKMVQGMDLFERLRPSMAPNAVLRFKLLPRRHSTDLAHVLLEVVGSSFAYEVPIAADQTFTLQRDRKATAENAVVSPNRRKLTMTWRTDIRTPGLPPNTRRLGDMRLECLVGLEADLVSNKGALGSIARVWISSAVARHYGEAFPLGTLVVNVTGSFLIGFFATLTGLEGRWVISAGARIFFMAGLCGGYTTFSAFSLQTLNLAREGDWFRAGLYAALSFVCCLVAVWLGHFLAATLNSTKGG